MAYYQLEPFGTEVDMLGHAITSATIANVNRGKNQRAYKPEDFMPDFDKANRTQSTDEMIQFASYMTEVMGGKDKRNVNNS
jgi:hypothetical protein